jgi:hypothetical protein
MLQEPAGQGRSCPETKVCAICCHEFRCGRHGRGTVRIDEQTISRLLESGWLRRHAPDAMRLPRRKERAGLFKRQNIQPMRGHRSLEREPLSVQGGQRCQRAHQPAIPSRSEAWRLAGGKCVMIGPRVSIGGWVDHLQMPTGPASCCNGRAYLAVQAHRFAIDARF